MILYHTLTLNNVIAPAKYKPKTEDLQVQFMVGFLMRSGYRGLLGWFTNSGVSFPRSAYGFSNLSVASSRLGSQGSSSGCPEDAESTGMSFGTGFFIDRYDKSSG